MDASKLKSLAETHCQEFANSNKDPANKDIPSLAKAYCSFFNPSSFISFAPTGPQTYTSSSAVEPNMNAWLTSLSNNGIDPFRLSQTDIRVEVIASRVALCWMTTVFTPTDGEPFGCPLVYSYRVPVGQEKGDWDFIVSDTQLEVLQEKCPEFFETQDAPRDLEGPGVFS